MPKPAHRSYSRYAREAAELLGLLIRHTRVGAGLTVAEVAERAGVSRGLVHRIEKGEMGSSIGATFEVAAIVGLRLFEAEPTTLARHLAMERDRLTLLPQSVRSRTLKVKDDF
ncbi:helix-turn-helix transcriptional regulator [Acidihalobacter ferrooxydans]|uniref:Transcriptional regulator n=1 Tax=Acidihalobacter ferrooxydans TaxID=1765967 RepID=A0A1P8UFV0_9GAMM|nr:helix-turn-helix transcriptional regulator [Acidihalobacter ferrooxydans]APZ42718.1 transcriptional regulator [Acidihalobacter ferrooxydans]